ncbi:MAG: thiamine pyrophosphate-binding protein [Deltaproteobacteria bacterium]|nr:thiamine pyrophosphate-binding protein [Deltaproteobacteria bacterium]
MKTGAQLLCGALEAAGVRHAFGLPGTQDVALHEALRRSSIRFVNTTHELAATFMANGYFRASGLLAPVFAIPGPGFLYALTGLAEAAHDSVAALLVVGAPPRAGPGFPFQRLDQAALARPIAKATVEAGAAAEIEGATRRAVSLAFQDEPGPVVLQWEPEALAGLATGGGAPAASPPAPDAGFEVACARAAGLLAGARRPVILAGQGALAAAGAVVSLAERLGAPVATTTSGRGLLPEDHPLSLAFELARGGLEGLNALLEAADAVLVLGCKLGAASSGSSRLALPADRTVRVDTSRAVLDSGRPAAIQVLGTAEAFVASLARRIGAGPPRPGAGWEPAEVAAWRARLAEGAAGRLPELAVRGIDPQTTQALFGALRRALPREAIVVTDSGQHQEAARRWLEIRSPRGLIVPSDFQSMGFGLPAAIGAALAAPGRPVVAVVGDGAFAMTAMELLTAARLRLQLVVVVLADGFLNRVRLQQLASLGHPHAVDLQNPDFAAFAEAVGAAHELVEGDAEAVFRRALRRPGVSLLEVRLGDSAAVRGARARGMARGLRQLPLARRLAGWLAARQRG